MSVERGCVVLVFCLYFFVFDAIIISRFVSRNVG